MSRENVETLKRAFDRVGEDPSVFWAIFDERVEWEMGHVFPDAATYHGVEGVQEFFRKWIGAFDDFGFEAEEVVDLGESVLVLLHQWGRGRGSGALVDSRFWQVWTFRNGKVVRYSGHRDRSEAVEAAGLRD